MTPSRFRKSCFLKKKRALRWWLDLEEQPRQPAVGPTHSLRFSREPATKKAAPTSRDQSSGDRGGPWGTVGDGGGKNATMVG